MNMNIIQLVERLKDVPDASLIGYLKDPNLQVPSALALAEISRRKQIRAAAAPQVQPQAPQATVADQMMSADQGVASLPVPDTMYDEQAMAAGGIVAFEEGGEVPGFYDGSFSKYMESLRQPQKLSQDDIAYHRALSNVDYDPTEAVRRGFAYTKDILTAPGQLSWMRDPKTGKLVRAYEVEGFMPRSTGFSAAEEAKKQSQLARLDLAEADNITRANLSGKPVNVGTTREGINQLVSDATAPQSAFMDRMVDIPVAAKNVKSIGDTRTRKEKAVVDTAAGTGKGGPTRDAYGDLVFNPVTVDDAGYSKLMPKEQSMRDYAAEFKSELGEDAGRVAMKDRLAKMQAMGEKESERAPWMALAEAGLGMAAGRSQFALQNIAEGGIRGIKSFAEARDNLRKAEERRFELESKVAQAERAEQLAAINYGADSKRADDASRRTIGLQQQTDKARASEVNAKGQLDAVTNKYQLGQKDREMAMTHDYQMGHLALQREANTLTKSTQLAEKQRAMYEKALDNARTDVMNSAKMTGTEGSMTQQQYDSAVYARYLENLGALGLKPLGSASGFKVLGVEGQKR
jgi:hypothetical protein